MKALTEIACQRADSISRQTQHRKLLQPSKLNREEFEIMKGHTLAGAKMLSHIVALANVIPGIRSHHEYWNGTGYPDGLLGEAIPLQGRIIHIGDAFDAITTDRIYRRKKDVKFAMAEIVKYARTQFDPSCVTVLEEAFRQGRIHEGLPDATPTIHELIDQIR